MPLPKESWSSYIKFSKSGKSGTKRSSTNLPTRDMCYSSRDALGNQIIGKEIEISQIDRTISTHGDTDKLSIRTMTQKRNKL